MYIYINIHIYFINKKHVLYPSLCTYNLYKIKKFFLNFSKYELYTNIHNYELGTITRDIGSIH